MASSAENPGFGENADSTDTINLHLDVWVAIRVAKVSQMGTPSSVLGITFDNDGVFIECVGEGEGSFGLLPRVEIVRLFTTEPVRKRTPDVYQEIDQQVLDTLERK